VALTPRGVAQAKAAATRLAEVAFTHAYCSQFLRARQTAEYILVGRDLRLSVDARLNERRSGLDGQPVEAFDGMVRPDPVHILPPAGESFLETMQRLAAFLDDLTALHPMASVLAVSHENPILSASALAGHDPEQAARGSLGNGKWLVLDWPVQVAEAK
jgi:alpha-ribazole phosphatase